MKITKCLFVLSFILSLTTYAQTPGFTFGKVSNEDLLMTSYDKDPTATALVLYEKGKAEIKKDHMGRLAIFNEYKVRIKILTREGLSRADVEVPLFNSLNNKTRESLESVEALVVNPDRSIGRLNKKDVYMEQPSETVRLAKFAIPNVQVGAVIDYQYVIKSRFFYYFVSWKFQEDIPKKYSELHTLIPANYQYNIKFTGPLKLTKHVQDLKRDCLYFQGVGTSDCSENRYIMTDIPAFVEEEYMMSKDNYLSAIDFELSTFQDFQGQKQDYTKTWETVDKEVRYEDLGKASKKESYFKKNLPGELIKGSKDIAGAKAIYYFLQQRLNSSGADHLFRPLDLRSAYENGAGSNTELNLILLNALKAAGFEANFMLASTRDNGIPSATIPGISIFNSLVVKLDIEDKTFLLDLAEKHMPFGMIRFELLNIRGRVMDFDKGSYWHSMVTESARSKASMHASFDLEEGLAKVREVTTGYFGFNLRDHILTKGEEDYINDLENLLEKRGEFGLRSYELTNLDNPEKGFMNEYEVELGHDEHSEKIFINPFLLESFARNPFQLRERTYPVDFGYPYSYDYTIFIQTNDQLVPEELPASVKKELPENIGDFNYEVKQQENSIMIRLQMRINRSRIPASKYEELKDFFNDFVRIVNNKPITLKRLSSEISVDAGEEK